MRRLALTDFAMALAFMTRVTRNTSPDIVKEKTMNQEKISQVAIRNDRFRSGGLGVMLTRGVRELDNLPGLLKAVRDFNAFLPGNDPYGEHDFGSLSWESETVYWKIDYYDAALEFGEYPLSRRCRRVLTIMTASEY